MKAPDEYLAMYAAHEHGDVDTVRKLLEAHPELEEMGPDGDTMTWLHVAAEKGQIALAEFWLGRGYDVNLNKRGISQKKDGLSTPLRYAKDAAMTRYLISRGAMVNACYRWGGTALHSAIRRAVEPSQRGRRRPCGADMDQIRALLDAGADLSLMNSDDKGYTPLAWAICLGRKTAEQLLREAGAPENGRQVFGSRRKIKKLDLRKDFNAIYKHLEKRVRKFEPAGGNVLGGPDPIKMIEVGFEYSQAGWVVVIFDTRPNAEPDGEWTSLIEGNELERSHWLEAEEANLDEPITVIQLDGTEAKLPSGTELAEILGELVKAVLLKARRDGVFAGLAKAPRCELGVEHFSGAYGWPAYEDRGQDNLAEPGAAPGPGRV